MRAFLRSSIRAAATVRLWPLAAAVGVWAGSAVAVNRRLSLAMFDGVAQDRALASATDAVTRTMWLVANAPHVHGPAVVSLGASSLREALDDQPTFSARLRSIGVGAAYVPLITSGQSMTESLALLASLRVPRGSVVFAQLTPIRIAENATVARDEVSNPRFPLIDYGPVDSLLANPPVSRLPFALWRARGYVSHYAAEALNPDLRACLLWQADAPSVAVCARLLVDGPRFVHASEFREHEYPDAPMSLTRKADLSRRLWYQFLGGDTTLGFGEEVARRIDRLCASRHWTLVWVRLPSDPIAAPIERNADLAIDALLREPRASAGTVLDLRQIGFASDEFYDLHHVRPRGRKIITETVVDAARAMLPPSTVAARSGSTPSNIRPPVDGRP